MDFLSERAVTEIIKTLVANNALSQSDLVPFVSEAARACVEADRMLSGKANTETLN